MSTSDDLRIGVRALAHLARFLERTCDRTGITLSQYRLLSYLDNAERRAGDLADQAAVSRPALTMAVDGLVERGLVSRGRLPDDGRAIAVRLTAKGHRALREADDVLGELLVGIVTEDELAAVLSATRLIGDGMARTFGDQGVERATERAGRRSRQ